MKHIKLFEQFLNEDIGKPPGGEYEVNWLHDMVMQGKKDLHFLVTKHPMVNTWREIELLNIYENMPDFDILKVNKKDGDAWIAYRNTSAGKKKAKRLKEIADSHDGYLNDKTPDEAREIGKLLDYNPGDTENYIKRRYN